MESLIGELNLSAARLARQAADEVAAATGRQRFVAGALGPTGRTASLSPDVNDPGFRNITFDELVDGYSQAARALIEGRRRRHSDRNHIRHFERQGRIVRGARGFGRRRHRIAHHRLGDDHGCVGTHVVGPDHPGVLEFHPPCAAAVVGLNCALGGKQLRPYIEELATIADANVCAYPNAGLPNAFGEYDETPEQDRRDLREFAVKRFSQHGGWLLRHDARPHSRHSAGGRGCTSPAACPKSRAPAA